ncbi:hypothetical protein [Nostoc sp.]|uniref:hypothetical protein n=1 Tax=Nostoc sp. TaxID=1180 RepID=UPI002FF8BE3E
MSQLRLNIVIRLQHQLLDILPDRIPESVWHNQGMKISFSMPNHATCFSCSKTPLHLGEGETPKANERREAPQGTS